VPNAFLTNAFLTNAFLTNAFLANAFLTNAYIMNAFLTNAFLTNACGFGNFDMKKNSVGQIAQMPGIYLPICLPVCF
jgi:uncharacterized protein YjbI with pentapeptide repeats